MWYHIRAKDMDIDKPNGMIITFWLWADDRKDLDDMLKIYLKIQIMVNFQLYHMVLENTVEC